MAHFAELDDNNIVIKVLSVNNNELIDNGTESEGKGVLFLNSLFGNKNWKQTSYNGNFRKNYACIGYKYDQALDAFIPNQPFPSWTLDTSTCRWQPPASYPSDGQIYVWNENTLSWSLNKMEG
jgi:hypothetical protein